MDTNIGDVLVYPILVFEEKPPLMQKKASFGWGMNLTKI